MSNFIRDIKEIRMGDLPDVGGKNASLGEMMAQLSDRGVQIPQGFVVTAGAYDALTADIRDSIEAELRDVDKVDVEKLSITGHKVRSMIRAHGLPDEVKAAIREAYQNLASACGADPDVAVRSSATAEDLPEASFAGQQESFLNIRGEAALLDACLNCFASLFTDRAISYRIDKGFDHMSVRLSIGVQKMVRSDKGTAGVIFTLDPESGFKKAILITSAYGLGENVVAGRVDPDEFLVFKDTFKEGYKSIIRRKVGEKQLKMVYSGHGSRTTRNLVVPPEEREQLSLSDNDVLILAEWACVIEDHYSKLHGRWTPMDIEWAKDGVDGKLYIVQARPETVHATKNINVLESYHLESSGEILLEGRSIGEKIGSGPARVIRSQAELYGFEDGEVLVADMTDPDWEPVMARAAAIVTNRGGRTCHAAIVSRELGVPCVVGTGRATELLERESEITISCADGDTGVVFRGRLPFRKEEILLDEMPVTNTKIMLNLANPEQAFSLSGFPVEGVGLAREEFIIAHEVKIHPLALTRFDSLKDQSVKDVIAELTCGFKNREDYFVSKLAEGIGMIAAAFYPKDVIVRLSDFKTNEYANLIGGRQFEPVEENPMIGFRGASRYYDERYRDGFALECRAFKEVREVMGLTNVKVMVPFCRTVKEGELVLEEMRKNGLVQGDNGLEVYVMSEIPANVILAEEFAEIFDGFSIGSNDLTQLVLGVDRDSEILAHLFDERNCAVKKMIGKAIEKARKAGRKIGICGQAPSDYPEFAAFLVEEGIDSISLNKDAVIKTLLHLASLESEQKKKAVQAATS